jgi:hypothetical protein
MSQLARHSEMNRCKILSAFGAVPNIIEMAQNKAETFPMDSKNPKSVQLHKSIQELQETLLRTLPALINKLIPGTFCKNMTQPAQVESVANSSYSQCMEESIRWLADRQTSRRSVDIC